MTGHITISIWLFILLLAVAVLAILDRVLIPSTRWFAIRTTLGFIRRSLILMARQCM